MGDCPEGAERICRNPSEAWLQAENAGERCRDADRSAAIRPDMKSAHAGRGGDGGASARSARRHRGVPGIAGDAGERAVGDALVAQFRCRGLAQQHGSVFPQPRRGRGILLPRLIGGNRLAAAQRRPSLRQDEVLDGGRHAVHQTLRFTFDPAFLAGARRFKSRIAIDQREGVEISVQCRDTIKAGLCHFDRGQAAAAVKAEKFRGGEKGWISLHIGVCQCFRGVGATLSQLIMLDFTNL